MDSITVVQMSWYKYVKVSWTIYELTKGISSKGLSSESVDFCETSLTLMVGASKISSESLGSGGFEVLIADTGVLSFILEQKIKNQD